MLSSTDGTGYNDTVNALDSHNAVQEEPSVFSSIGNVVTKGIPLTGLSIINSFANTATELGNFLGGTNNKLLTVEDEVGEGDLLDYYKNHAQGIEAAGLIAGSLIPGTIAVKALKLAQAGMATTAIARATNLFAGPRTAIITNAVKEINAGDAALYGALTADKVKAIALGFGDQALQALAYETATAATMKASPLLDADGLADTVQNIFIGALVGGGIGGVIEGIGTNAIIKKALLNRDVDTKFAELATYLESGKGKAYNPGDKVVALLDSIDALPVGSVDPLLAKKAGNTVQAAILNSKKILSSLVQDGDESLTNAMFDVLYRMKVENGMGKEEMYDYLARLGKVQRITEAVSKPDGSVFYVNNFLEKDADVTWNKLVSSEPGGDVNRAFMLRKGSTSPKIARFDETMDLGNGVVAPKYSTAEEAYADGADMYVGKNRQGNLQVFVNKDAPNLVQVAKPGESRALTLKEEKIYRDTGKLPEGASGLYTSPIILNTLTGDISEKAVAVVGDYGKVSKIADGLLYGDQVSIQSVASAITSETATIDANARYVWAAERGLQRGDSIVATDIPMLEQVLRTIKKSTVDQQITWEKAVELFDKRGITISGADALPTNSEDALVTYIRNQKDTLIAELTSKHPDLTVDDVALRANVSKDYLANNLSYKDAKDFLVPVEQHMKVNHVALQYDIGSLNTVDGMIARGMIDVQYRIDLIKRAATAQTASFFGADFKNFIASKLASDADIGGVGAGAFSFSNAAYNSLGQQMERIGRFVTEKISNRMGDVSSRLTGPTNAVRQDPLVAAEVGNFIHVRRSTNETYRFLPPDIAAAEQLPANTVVLSNALQQAKDGSFVWNKGYTPEGFVSYTAKQAYPESQGFHTYYSLSDKAAEFERTNMLINNERIAHRNGFYQANGMSKQLVPDTLYAPPIDTKKYPYFAYVKQRPGAGMATDDVAVITAASSKELDEKIASLGQEYSVFTKKDLKLYHEVEGDYDFSRNFMQNDVNNALQRKGVLNNIFPDTRAETIIRDYVDWHSRLETRLIRDHVELANSQLFSELRAMGDRFSATEGSKVGITISDIGRTAKNPYDDYVKTALAISTKDEYRLWANANEKLEAFFSTAFNTAKTAFMGANKGLISYEEASAMSQKFGLGNVYEKGIDALKTYTDVANKLPPERYLSKFVAAANSALAATAIRLDAFQSLINAVSTPILLLAESQSATKLLTTELPDGSGRLIPASSKVLFNAVNNYFDTATRTVNLELYKKIGAVRNKSSEYFEMINELTLPFGKLSESETLAKIKSFTDKGAKLTGSELSEEFGRYIAANAAHQIFDAAGYTGQQLLDNISTFVNRVHGNYIASQRPVAFQGPIGQAIGLFQTYQFNLMQQVFRYVENKEGRTLATLAGMQTTLFGLQGLPGFQAINNHIIGNSANNPAHKDAYSTAPSFFDKKLGDYLLYGVASNWMSTGLYSRGDINPRQISILPTNPLDYPAIAGGIKLMGALVDTAGKIAQGGNIPTSLLLGLEHNGLSRPLTGMAQIAQGFVTTSQGSLVAKTSGWSDIFDASNYARLLGARPLDEAIVMDAMYRKTLYTAKDASRIKELGQTVKTYMYGNSTGPTAADLTDFANKYAASGGQIRMFSRKMQEWSLDANSSVANQIYRNMKLPQNQQIQMMMGGVPLPDFQNSSVPSAPAAETP